MRPVNEQDRGLAPAGLRDLPGAFPDQRPIAGEQGGGSESGDTRIPPAAPRWRAGQGKNF